MVVVGRPTQNHHNCSVARLRKHYDKETATAQTKVNILTLVSAEQQTHNYYAEHGMMYGNDDLRRMYGEICDVEEEHVTMYESLIDPTESVWEKLLLHEFTEVCTYYNCYKDEIDEKLKAVWEEFLAHEIGHLHVAAEIFKTKEDRDPEEVIGNEVVLPCHFETQKTYVTDILLNEVDKRLDGKEDKGYTTIDRLPEDWASYRIQNAVNAEGAPTEQAIRLAAKSLGRDLVIADKKLIDKEPELIERGLQPKPQAPNTVSAEEYKVMSKIKPADL